MHCNQVIAILSLYSTKDIIAFWLRWHATAVDPTETVMSLLSYLGTMNSLAKTLAFTYYYEGLVWW